MTSLPLTRAFTCFSTLVYIRARFRFALIGENLTSQLTGSHRGIGGGIQIPGTKLQALLPFPAPPPEHPGELAHRLHLYHPAIFSSRDHITSIRFNFLSLPKTYTHFFQRTNFPSFQMHKGMIPKGLGGICT